MSGIMLKRKHARTVLEVALTLAKEGAEEVLITMSPEREAVRVRGSRADREEWAMLEVSTTSGDVLSYEERDWLEWDGGAG